MDPVIPALLTAAKRRVLCLLGRHDWAVHGVRPATHYICESGVWRDTGIRAGGFLGSRVCRVAACQRVEVEVRPGKWVSAEKIVPYSDE